MTGPGVTVLPPDCEQVDFTQLDFDRDGDTDLTDAAAHQAAHRAP
jgi:hypothetical protein